MHGNQGKRHLQGQSTPGSSRLTFAARTAFGSMAENFPREVLLQALPTHLPEDAPFTFRNPNRAKRRTPPATRRTVQPLQDFFDFFSPSNGRGVDFLFSGEDQGL